MIGTHNSQTGEPSKGLLSTLVVPFAKTQNKTLVQQWHAGVRYFDIRMRYNSSCKLVFAHGLWTGRTKPEDALSMLNSLASQTDDETYISITYEGELANVAASAWEDEIIDLTNNYPNLTLVSINIKKPTWRCLYSYSNHPPVRQGFKSLDGTSWHTYIPIPWLWNKVFSSLRVGAKEEDGYVLLDFV